MKKEERLLKVGILGCGAISQAAHIDASRKARNVDLFAACDVAEDLLERISVNNQIPHVYRAYDEMLKSDAIDAIIIGIADQFHVEAALKAIDAGKHVLIEKPLGVTIEECEELRKKVREKNLIFQVGNMKRYDPGIAYAQKFIRDEMGEMLALKAWYCDNTYRYTVTDNVMPVIEVSSRSKRPDGNPKLDKERYYILAHGSHLVDTARFLGGNIVSIQASHVEKYNAHTWFAMVEFENGSIGHLDLTVSVRMDWHEGFQVYGEYGSVVGKTYNPWIFKATDVEVFSTKDGLFRRPLGADAHFYKLQLEGFADTVLHKTPMTGATVDDGIAAMRAMVALSQSAKTGKKVMLNEVSGGIK